MIIEGDENNPYEIFNSSMPLLETTVERGCASSRSCGASQYRWCGKYCEGGLSSANEFCRAYLNILRQSGLTRRQEVQKVFEGGVQRVAQLTVASYEVEEQRKKDAEERKKKRLEEEGGGEEALGGASFSLVGRRYR